MFELVFVVIYSILQAKCMESVQDLGKVYHNNICPDAFRLTTDGKVVLEGKISFGKLNSIHLTD